MPPLPPVVSISSSSSSIHTASGTGTPTRRVPSERTPTFNEHQENTHRIEFEAPLSSDAEAEQKLQQQQGRFSIDLSLELERQLAMESPPITPGHDTTTHPKAHSRTTSYASVKSAVGGSETLPDPDVLVHIVTQLRQSLADMTKERDELIKMLAHANTQEAYTKDALQLMTEKATEAEEELTAARKKMKEDEEQIAMLRSKVEESRRGLMRLQTENRRQSIAPIDVSRASSFAALVSPPSSKRASFAPLTGSGQGRPGGHRRISSVSDSGFGTFSPPDPSPSPNARAFNIASAEAALSGAPSSSRRYSGFYGRHSPGEYDNVQVSAAAEAVAEMESLRTKLKTVTDALDTVKHDLSEANEAREASETCVKALREFIAENNIGATAVKLPPPPTMTTGDENMPGPPNTSVGSADPRRTASGWGFKLWGSAAPADSPLRSSIGTAPFSASAPSPQVASQPATYASPNGTTTISAAPLSRKFGGLFSSRSSVSSTSSQQQQPQAVKLPHLQTNAAARDSVYSYSDTSSVAEPVSPGADIDGLGTGGYHAPVGGEYKVLEEGIVVRDVTNLSRVDRTGTVKVSDSMDLDSGLR
ncbi:hypothetical protein NLJ89_g2217 [Agrocybe chaxingu]|uniref:Uncharacterized protein n=1 Tax=Agrocybe chaxingu TaxID=84603 RepID=A0A9W8MXT7_9AGAR|nr:hypothetical protein NLJ89_g2217 [Agrocybe chaxingu]